jgi:hypothetical protein|tara:strand:+ start:2818 stop:3255 length:438 start_codon:yes stop_codon:yes gene_type:complete
MQITNLSVDLSKKYINTPLEPNALIEVIKGSSHFTAHRLYLIVNELKERYKFLEVDDHERYVVSASVYVKYAYAGAAKRQAATVSFMEPLLKQRNEYKISFYITERETRKELFDFSHETTSQQELCDLINMLRIKTKEICNQNTL